MIRFSALISCVCAFVGCAVDAEVAPFDADLDVSAVDADADLGAAAPLPYGTDLNANFEVLFAPDDPVLTLELALIDRVIAAAREDGGDYAEGENPFSIRYAVYNLRNADIVERLAVAEHDGVDVQILIEKDQLDPSRDWNTADETLVERGFELVGDHDDLDDETRISADLIGVSGGGLMHLKTRLYGTPDGMTLLTGSMNPGDNAVFNDETLHLVNEPSVVSAYAAAFEAVRDETGLANSWDDGAAVQALFSPADSGPTAGARILDWVSEEDEQILLMVYSLRDFSAESHYDSLLDVLEDRIDAGVPVYIITDRKQSGSWGDSTAQQLRDIGAHVWEVSNTTTEFTAMHHKVAVLGRSDVRVITDAANWTTSALGSSTRSARNTESALFIDTEALDGGRTGRRYMAAWMRTLHKYADQGAPEGEPGFDDVYAALVGQHGWPLQPVMFAADDAETSWGEDIYVVGDHAELDVWGEDGPGLRLSTDADLYPSWESLDAAEMPLGTPFEWKLVARYREDGPARWETGWNRSGFAGPPVLVGGGLELTGAWR